MDTRKLNAEDLFEIGLLGRVSIHPDKPKAAVTVTHLDREQNKYETHIWTVPTESGEPSLFTNSTASESAPAWSPDGKWLAFLSNRIEDKNQIFLISEAGGEAFPVTRMKEGIDSFQWSPDGSKIAFTSSVSERSKEQRDEDSTKTNESPREKFTKDVKCLTRTFYRLDGAGFFDQNRTHLFVVNVANATQAGNHAQSVQRLLDVHEIPYARITEGSFDIDSFDWAPDCHTIVISTSLAPDTQMLFTQHLYELTVPEIDGKTKKAIVSADQFIALTENLHYAIQPRFSPDGNRIACRGAQFDYAGYTQLGLWVYDRSTHELRCVTEGHDQPFTNESITDTRANVKDFLYWDHACKHLYSLVSIRGTVQIARVAVETATVEIITDGDHCINEFSMDRNANTIVMNLGHTLDPANVYKLDLTNQPISVTRDSLTKLTSWNAEWLSQVQLAKPQRFTFENDGWTLDGWVMLPQGDAPKEGFPTVVQVHGGPMAMYADAFFLEFQLLAASGMAVVYTNPRGSMGYGQEFCRCIRGDWGNLDFKDVEAGVDAALAQFPLKCSTIAIAGGSYGGFMAAWAIGQTDRYQAAVVMRPVTNWYSLIGTSDLGFLDPYDFELKKPWDDPERYLRISPITYVNNVKASVLITHSENDYRCPMEQAEQFYLALKLRDIPVELVRFPDESHGLSRNGKPWHRVFRLEKIQTFLEKELLDDTRK